MHYTEMTDEALALYSDWLATQDEDAPASDEDDYLDLDLFFERD